MNATPLEEVKMSSRNVGKCVNFRKCPKADGRETIPVAARDANPVCPNCGHSLLISTPVVHPRRNALVAAGIVVAFLFVGVGFAVTHSLTRGSSNQSALPSLTPSASAVVSAPVAVATKPLAVSSAAVPVSSALIGRPVKPIAALSGGAKATSRDHVNRVGAAATVAAAPRSHAVPVTVEQPPAYAGLVRTADKVDVAVHFGRGSDILENRADTELGRLASRLKTDGYRNRKVLVAGFADDTGDAEYSGFLSAKRAQTVGAVLASHGVNVAQTFGFGQAIPIGDNSTRIGRKENRRVEIFVVR